MTSTTDQSPSHPGGHTGEHSGAHGHGHADVVLGQEFWEERYGSGDAIWSGQPNPQLIAEVSGLAPGRALEIGCGEGADAVWLAERGWQVTATDISTVALGRAEAHARQLGPEIAARISWRHTDLVAPELPAALVPGDYDLVTAQFMHVPAAQRVMLHQRLAAAVAPGGVLLVVGHAQSDLETGVRRPPSPGLLDREGKIALLHTSAEIAAVLAPGEWTVLVDEERGRTATGPDGEPVTVHDTVLKARRGAA